MLKKINILLIENIVPKMVKITPEMKEALEWLWNNKCSCLEKEIKAYKKNKKKSLDKSNV